jgi:hypothetical protein
MKSLENIPGSNDRLVSSYENFWKWFQENEKEFYRVVKEQDDIEKNFFDKLSPKLKEINDGFFYLAGMLNKNTAEIVFTTDGAVKHIVFVEELVNKAPKIENWVFTTLKPSLDIKDVSIEMAGHKFNDENISFYPNEHPDFPDEIDITVVHNDLNEENRPLITNGTYLFLDNFLGELNFATAIDTLAVTGKESGQKELVPIGKLKDYLLWRQKEFIEKYDGVRYNTDKDNHSVFEAKLENDHSLVAVINTDLLEWDSKASHPWILNIEVKYNGEHTRGMPDKETDDALQKIENDFLERLHDFEGALHIGRQTAEGTREIYFACKDFRTPSKIAYDIQLKYAARFDINYGIYKDKYWQSFNRFVTIP